MSKKDIKEEALIDALVSDLKPEKPLWSPTRRFALWSLVMLGAVAGGFAATGNLRADAFHILTHHPWFLLEMLVAYGCGLLGAWSALQLSVPRLKRSPALYWAAPLTLVLFGLLLLKGFWMPAMPEDASVHRDMCAFQIMGFAIVPLAVLFYLVARAAPFESRWVAGLAGMGATAIPAATMQLGCVYEPMHNLIFHYLPIMIMVVIAMAGADFISSRLRRRVPGVGKKD